MLSSYSQIRKYFPALLETFTFHALPSLQPLVEALELIHVRKLASYPRQNGLAWALREVGRLEKTLFTLEWLQSVELRRRVQVGLNKGEARNALARAVFFYQHERVQDRSHAQQQRRAQGFNLVIAAIILWNTLELARAVEELQQEGMTITPEQLTHLSPMEWEHLNLTGYYVWDLTVKSPHVRQA